MPKSRPSFMTFYRDHYFAEHSHPANIALHVAGTLLGLGLIAAALTVISPWWLLAFPVVHVGPGLIGHRFFERNPDVGDVRVLRTDVPVYLFLFANHLLTWRLLTGRSAQL